MSGAASPGKDKRLIPGRGWMAVAFKSALLKKSLTITASYRPSLLSLTACFFLTHKSKARLLFCGFCKKSNLAGKYWQDCPKKDLDVSVSHPSDMCHNLHVFTLYLTSLQHQINSDETGSVPQTRRKQVHSGLTDKQTKRRKWLCRFCLQSTLIHMMQTVLACHWQPTSDINLYPYLLSACYCFHNPCRCMNLPSHGQTYFQRAFSVHET